MITEEQSKFCPRCKVTLKASSFYISSAGKLRAHCKECCRAMTREAGKTARESNPEKLREKARAWHEGNRERIAAKRRERHKENPEKRRKQAKDWYQNNSDRAREINDKSISKHIESRRAWRRNYDKGRRTIVAEQINSNPNRKLGMSLRRYVCKKLRLRGAAKAAATIELLGCSVQQLRQHLEALFQPGMSWESHGLYGWHIDHKIPCAAFDLTDPEQQRRCFHYTNLQPLWAADNLRKSDKIL